MVKQNVGAGFVGMRPVMIMGEMLHADSPQHSEVIEEDLTLRPRIFIS